MINFENITILIPLRIDSEERKSNMDTTLEHLSMHPRIKIHVMEADATQKYWIKSENSRIKYCFIKDDDPVFFRTHYLNHMLREVRTPIAGIWDSDVIIPMDQLFDAMCKCLDTTTLCYPFDGRFYAVSDIISRLYRENREIEVLKHNESIHWLMHGKYSVGGAFVVNIEKYLIAGGENEHFYGWGPEDTERRERILNLGLRLERTTGCLYHLNHPRSVNSGFATRDRAIYNRGEYLKICNMNCEELKMYISTWPWVDKSNDVDYGKN